MTLKKSAGLAMASATAVLALFPLTAFAASNTPVLMASTKIATAGQSVTYTVEDPAASSSTEYQFWVEQPSGQWTIAKNYSLSDQLTLSNVKAGTYEVVAYALSKSAVQAHDWTMAMATSPDSLYVNASVTLNVVTKTSSSGAVTATVTVNAVNIGNAVYQLWWKTPAGNWHANGAYQIVNTFTLPLTEPGTYEFVAFAKPPAALSNNVGALASAPVSISMSTPAEKVTLSPAVSGLHTGSDGVDPVTVSVVNAQGQLISNFNGSVSVSDSEGLLMGASGSLTNMVTVPIQNGVGQVQVMAGNTASTDQITASGLSAATGSVMASSIQYQPTWISMRDVGGNISQLNTIMTVASTVDSTNGDQNPYGLTFDSFKGTSQAPNPFYGDLLVSNFSNKAGTNGDGTTIEAINPMTGAVKTFASTADGPVALAVSPKGPLWIANFGTNGTNGNDEVLEPNGKTFPNNGSIITNGNLDGPWGQVFVPNATAPAFFVTNALNGTIDAMYGFAPPNFNTDTKFTEIGSGLAHSGSNANNVQGPQGMVYDPTTHMVYVTDTADNSIRAYYWNGANTPNQGQGQLIYQGGALNAPVGITWDPLNGDLLVVNQGNNNLVEIDLNNGHAFVAGQKVLDNTPVNPQTGAGSALFGVYAMNNNGQLNVFFTDDNTNTLDVLK
ncbi:hypothetical protein [Sulfobacillus thermosulfidooxidans]|uniref:hypothetical protein n=1 Tax=Sulfobacillus thermosulfidooxidans TaxID=28034 RepID=UPI0002EAB293|nr:hypothetical protein [Sulfobacillus thermosulfidooxidans]